MSVELRPGDKVETPDGPGVVRNLVKKAGAVVVVLVELDEGPTLYEFSNLRPWHTYDTNDLKPVNPRLL